MKSQGMILLTRSIDFVHSETRYLSLHDVRISIEESLRNGLGKMISSMIVSSCERMNTSVVLPISVLRSIVFFFLGERSNDGMMITLVFRRSLEN